MTDFGALLATLGACGVEYMVVGEPPPLRMAAPLPIGSGLLQRWPLRGLTYGAPAGLPFVWDREVLRRGLNFTLVTSLGDIVLLGEIPGGGTGDDLHSGAIELNVFGTSCLCLSLPQLIRAKIAAGRPKDLEALAELEAIQDETDS